MRRPSLSEQINDYAITQEVAADARETRDEMRALDAEITDLRTQLAASQARVRELEGALSFADFAKTNMSRCLRWHDPQEWSVSDWAVAMAGEAGEVCNAVKKLNRVQGALLGPNGYHNNPASVLDAIQEIGKEIADTVIYCDLLAQRLNLNLAIEVAAKFNETSEKYGFPERLSACSALNTKGAE